MTDSRSIFVLITNGELSELQKLVAADKALAGSRNADGVSALMIAAYYRKTDMVRYLRGEVVDLDIFEAAALGEEQLLRQSLRDKQLLDARSADGFTPLHLAAFFNQPDCVQILLEQGAQVNAIAANPSRVQPLHSAVACRSVEIVRLLLDHDAAVNARQHGGWTALQAAAKHGCMELVELLLQHGADPDQPADDGQTAKTMSANDEIRDRLKRIN